MPTYLSPTFTYSYSEEVLGPCHTPDEAPQLLVVFSDGFTFLVPTVPTGYTYSLQMREDGTTDWITIAIELTSGEEFTIRGLKLHTWYYFQWVAVAN